MSNQQALGAYSQNQNENRAAVASPYRLVQLMFEKLLEHMALATGALERNDMATKGEHIGRAIDFLGVLRSALDLEAGGEVAGNLSRLYLFCIDTLTEANRTNNAALIVEATDIVRGIKTTWDELEDAARDEESV